MPTIRDVFYDLLRDLRMTTIFGNPGSTEETFLTEFPEDFRYVLGLHEASVLAMADGYAQATGRPAFVNVHTAPGLGNTMGNLVTARMNKTPLILTAGQQTREMMLLEPWLSNVEPTAFAKPHVKWAYEPLRAEDVPGALMRAYATAVQAPQGPVFLSLPMDDFGKPAGRRPAARRIAPRVAPDPEAIARIAEALGGAANPALVMGADIDRAGAWEAAVALAERTAATVFAPPSSERAGFPETHAQFAGELPAAIGPLCEALEGFDAVVVIGAPVFRYYPYVPGEYLPEGTALHHIASDPSETSRAPVGDAALGDAGLALEALLAAVPQSERTAPDLYRAPEAPEASDPMTAAGLMAAIAAARPDDAVVVQESPSNMDLIKSHLPASRPASYFTMSSGGLGFGLPASVGLALGEAESGRDRPVISIIGDGSFNYSVQALATAARERAKVVYIVPRNRKYAILQSFAKLQKTPGVPALDLPPYDIVAIAEGYRVPATRVSTPDEVRAAIERGLAGDGPTLVVAEIEEVVPDLM